MPLLWINEVQVLFLWFYMLFDIIISFRRRTVKMGFSDVVLAKQNNAIIKGIVTEAYYYGVLVDYLDNRIFIPKSLTGLMNSLDINQLVGKQVYFKIIDINFQKQRAVGSSREVLKHRQHEQTVLDKIEIGEIYKGYVESIGQYGAFVVFGGFTGLIHNSQFGVRPISNPLDAVSVGEVIDVQVIDIVYDKNRISLSRVVKSGSSISINRDNQRSNLRSNESLDNLLLKINNLSNYINTKYYNNAELDIEYCSFYYHNSDSELVFPASVVYRDGVQRSSSVKFYKIVRILTFEYIEDSVCHSERVLFRSNTINIETDSLHGSISIENHSLFFQSCSFYNQLLMALHYSNYLVTHGHWKKTTPIDGLEKACIDDLFLDAAFNHIKNSQGTVEYRINNVRFSSYSDGLKDTNDSLSETPCDLSIGFQSDFDGPAMSFAEIVSNRSMFLALSVKNMSVSHKMVLSNKFSIDSYIDPEHTTAFLVTNNDPDNCFCFHFSRNNDLILFSTLIALNAKICSILDNIKEEKYSSTTYDKGQPAHQAKELTSENTATVHNVKEQLLNLVGLEQIKKDVNELVSLLKLQKMREEKGFKTIPISLHLVFTGNPGTGKTTVARILANIYKDIGLLSKGQLIEVDRSGLVAGYVGQTAIKTQQRIDEAIGGILFVDEAYTLAKDGNDFGQEAIDTILKAMEDHRDDLVVIVAGYDEQMKKFINSNPGLKSRFNKYFHFSDYSADELIIIFKTMLQNYDYSITEEAMSVAEETIKKMEQQKDNNFANARDVRNYFEQIIARQAMRISKISNPTNTELLEITVEDVLSKVI